MMESSNQSLIRILFGVSFVVFSRTLSKPYNFVLFNIVLIDETLCVLYNSHEMETTHYIKEMCVSKEKTYCSILRN